MVITNFPHIGRSKCLVWALFQLIILQPYTGTEVMDYCSGSNFFITTSFFVSMSISLWQFLIQHYFCESVSKSNQTFGIRISGKESFPVVLWIQIHDMTYKKAKYKSWAECEFAVRGRYNLLRSDQLDVSLEWRPWKGTQSEERDFVDVERWWLSGSHGFLIFPALPGKKSSSYF